MDIFYSTIAGRVLNEPELTNDILHFNVAVGIRDGKDEKGADVWKTNYIQVTAFKDMATWAKGQLEVGATVTVTGKMRMVEREVEKTEGKKTVTEKRSFLNMTADQIFPGVYKKKEEEKPSGDLV